MPPPCPLQALEAGQGALCLQDYLHILYLVLVIHMPSTVSSWPAWHTAFIALLRTSSPLPDAWTSQTGVHLARTRWTHLD